MARARRTDRGLRRAESAFSALAPTSGTIASFAAICRMRSGAPFTNAMLLDLLEDWAKFGARNPVPDGMTMICITPEMGFARAVADRVLFMDAGQVIEEAAPVEFFERPRHERTQASLGLLRDIDPKTIHSGIYAIPIELIQITQRDHVSADLTPRLFELGHPFQSGACTRPVRCCEAFRIQ